MEGNSTYEKLPSLRLTDSLKLSGGLNNFIHGQLPS